MMAQLIYTALTSADGYIADAQGRFDWAKPGEDVHAYVNELEARNRILLLGKEMYSVLNYWENVPGIETAPAPIKNYALAWQSAQKRVYSTSLTAVDSANTVLMRSFDKSDVEALKQSESGHIGIGGAVLASQAFAMGLIDEIYRFSFPVLVGAGKPWLSTEKQIRLETLAYQAFAQGVTMTHYKVIGSND
jgi:dihydrofolate reductase